LSSTLIAKTPEGAAVKPAKTFGGKLAMERNNKKSFQ
jgi:hypothetical protein